MHITIWIQHVKLVPWISLAEQVPNPIPNNHASEPGLYPDHDGLPLSKVANSVISHYVLSANAFWFATRQVRLSVTDSLIMRNSALSSWIPTLRFVHYFLRFNVVNSFVLMADLLIY